jgi:DNA-binding NtrC family response regulator
MPSILVIDDEAAIRETLKEILEYEKYEVTLAEDGAKGLQLLQKNNFDVILSDVKMPGIDGPGTGPGAGCSHGHDFRTWFCGNGHRSHQKRGL